MPINTRFNPTTNGPLHIGHLYMILVNEYVAHESGGRFIFRFDDNQQYWLDALGEGRTEKIRSDMKDDMVWMNIRPDEYVCQSKIENDVFSRICALMDNAGPIPRRMYCHDEAPVTKSSFGYFPYAPYYTLEKVWMDFSEGVNLLIRGEDLITEFALYEHYVNLMGLPRMPHVYLPRLRSPEGELTDVSKTIGNYKIGGLRAMGFTAGDIRELLSESCLNDPSEGWSVDNVKNVPEINLELYKAIDDIIKHIRDE